MPEDFTNEQLLELKVHWTKHKIKTLQREIQGAMVCLSANQGFLEIMENHCRSVRNNQHALGLHLGAMWKELEDLKKL